MDNLPDPKPDDVLRRMLATKPKPKAAKPESKGTRQEGGRES